ncbi:MAG: hypothetical protein NTZ27_09910 [Ignavibacteriales bacterium]|nr:hypothetical protein [Ignavibacteriales bacterium]
MNIKKIGNSFLAIMVITLLVFSSINAQQKTETQQTQINSTAVQITSAEAPVIKIYGVQLIILSSPDKTQISKAPVNNTGAGGFKVSKAGTYFIKVTFGKKVEDETIKELNVDIKYPDGTRKTLTTTPASNGKSIESAEFEWTEPAKPLFAYLTSTQGKVNTLLMSEDKKK